MPEYAPGVPMWVDVSSSDMDRTRAFYSGLFGWNPEVVPDPQAGGYTMFMLDGKMVAAATPTFSPDQPAAWSTYVHSTDADSTAQAVQDAGGTVVAPPMDVMGQGHMAVFQDPTGAFVSIWQPQIHQGAEVVNDPNSFSWSELYTRDMPAAQDFYGKVFGWETEEAPAEFGAYKIFRVGGRSIAGGLDMTTMLPDSVPPHWLVYFTVEDAASAADKITELGGTIMSGPMPTPMGPIVVALDPVGALFGLVQFTNES